jgi:hypothetical protein
VDGCGSWLCHLRNAVDGATCLHHLPMSALDLLIPRGHRWIRQHSVPVVLRRLVMDAAYPHRQRAHHPMGVAWGCSIITTVLGEAGSDSGMILLM